MKEYEIVTVPNPKLSEVTRKVTSFSCELQNQIQKMVKVLRKEGGIGLAANQLGYDNRVIAIEFENLSKKEGVKEHIPLTIFINPEVVEFSRQEECLEEGCLSVPKIELEVDRPSKLKLKYQNQEGHKIKIAPKGLLARILQHEIDHLNGIIFTERVKKQFFQKSPEFKNLKIAFFGSGEFAAIILEGLILLGLNLDIYTEKAKPAGRNQQSNPTPVAQVCRKFDKKFNEIQNVSDFGFRISDFDLLICSDFGKIIPPNILNAVRIASLNIHPSLLPKYIGPTPVQTAILNGDKTTGVSIIKMINKIDEGPLYSQIEIEILKNDTYLILRDRLATLGLKLLVKTLPKIVSGEIEAIGQDLSKATRTRKFIKADGGIDWKKSPKKIDAQIRAFHLWPGSFTFIDNKRLIIHEAHLENDKLVLDLVQFEGKKSVTWKEFLRGYKGTKPEWSEKIKI